MPNPVEYAEQILGVHNSYQNALAAHEQYNQYMTDLDNLKDKRRDLDAEVDDREIALLKETRSTHPDWSKTAVNDHMKEAKNQDPKLRELRASLSRLNGEIAGLEADIKVQEHLLAVYVARMHELGGYFTFLAACKNAEVQTNAQENA